MIKNEKITEKLCRAKPPEAPRNPLLFRPLLWCTACAQLVHMVTPEAAILMTRTAVESLYQDIEHHRLHSMRTQAGSLLICVASLTEKKF